MMHHTVSGLKHSLNLLQLSTVGTAQRTVPMIACVHWYVCSGGFARVPPACTHGGGGGGSGGCGCALRTSTRNTPQRRLLFEPQQFGRRGARGGPYSMRESAWRNSLSYDLEGVFVLFLLLPCKKESEDPFPALTSPLPGAGDATRVFFGCCCSWGWGWWPAPTPAAARANPLLVRGMLVVCFSSVARSLLLCRHWHAAVAVPSACES